MFNSFPLVPRGAGVSLPLLASPLVPEEKEVSSITVKYHLKA